ncbi:MAG: three-Cys-motif partner protein TcmP [Anaerolineales bacterium]|nr:three-Cys-motif partner protein TcmP [Anaerolineales bacterium]
MSQSFFDEASEQSEVKSLLVSKYFWAWAKVMISAQKRYRPTTNRIAYIDLFAGPGRYKDGQLSTPLLVLQQAIEDVEMRQRLITIFNDKDIDNANALRNAIDKLPGVEKLKHKPVIWNFEVGEDIAETFERMNIVPSLFFVDPWGYKGLSLRLINAVVKDFGCDCIFFFNYNRINMGLGNEFVSDHIDALFGKARADKLRHELGTKTPADRESAIVNEICEALKDMGREYVLPFGFKSADGRRTSHHLIFVSKHVRGYEIMKGIMARHSSTVEQGVASFDFNPVANLQYRLLFDLSRPVDDLADLLLKQFSGKTLTMKEIYELHHVDTPYISSNYKDALNILEEKGLITCDPPSKNRPIRKGKRTFADRVKVSFL